MSRERWSRFLRVDSVSMLAMADMRKAPQHITHVSRTEGQRKQKVCSGFGTKTCAETRLYSRSRDSIVTRPAVGSANLNTTGRAGGRFPLHGRSGKATSRRH